MTTFRLTVLQLIAARDGKYSWYQIERALGQRGVCLEENLMDALKDFEEQSLILATPQANLPAQPLYSVSEQGRQLLARYA